MSGFCMVWNEWIFDEGKMSGLPSNSSSNSAPSLNHVDRLDYPRVCCWCGGDIHSTHCKTVGRTHNHHLLLWPQVYPSLLGYVNHSVVNSLYTSITIFNKSRGLSNSCGSTLDKVGCNLCKKEPEFCSGQGLRVNWSSCWVVPPSLPPQPTGPPPGP